MTQPTSHTADAIKKFSDSAQPSGKEYWALARPLPYYYGFLGSIKNRFKLAWMVFTGKGDVVTWIDQP